MQMKFLLFILLFLYLLLTSQENINEKIGGKNQQKNWLGPVETVGARS